MGRTMRHSARATAVLTSALALALGAYLRHRRPGPTDTAMHMDRGTATATATDMDTDTDTARLAERVAELAETRAGAVAAHGAELRRIERELHDGTQARLVSLSL